MINVGAALSGRPNGEPTEGLPYVFFPQRVRSGNAPYNPLVKRKKEELRKSIDRNHFFQGEGVLDGKTIGIVVEIDEDIFPPLPPPFDLFSPSFKLFV